MRGKRQACAAGRTRTARIALIALLGWLLAGPVVWAGLDCFASPVEASMQVQPEHAPERGAAGHEAEAGQHEGSSSLVATIAKIFNSAILVATLVYFLRPPIVQYLADRATQIQQDLAEAAETRDKAHADLKKLEQRLAELPAEIEALRVRGAQEMALEEARLRQTTDVLRERLLAQARREIDQEAKAAERKLLESAAELTVSIAAERIQRGMTERDQLRLVDRYVERIPA